MHITQNPLLDPKRALDVKIGIPISIIYADTCFYAGYYFHYSSRMFYNILYIRIGLHIVTVNHCLATDILHINVQTQTENDCKKLIKYCTHATI